MFGKLVSIIDKLNEGNIIEASNQLLEVAKEYKDQDKIVTFLAEIEKEMKEYKNDEEILFKAYSPFSDLLKKSIEEMRACRENKLKALILHTLYILSEGNQILLNMIRKSNIGRPNTYI